MRMVEMDVRTSVAIALAAALSISSMQARLDGPLGSGQSGPRLRRVEIVDVLLPGNPTQFDYQHLGPARGQVVIARLGDDSVVIVPLTVGTDDEACGGRDR